MPDSGKQGDSAMAFIEVPQLAVTTELQSDAHRKLLDAIVSLHRDGINEATDLPEIVVCGDQSAGKSSILEAITGLPFTRSTTTVTRFPIHVELCKTQDTEPIAAHIQPERQSWTPEQLQRLQRWKPDPATSSTSMLMEVVESAKAFLKSLNPKRNFWRDHLMIKLSSPLLPHLTLIDLPGLVPMNPEQNAHGGPGAETSTTRTAASTSESGTERMRKLTDVHQEHGITQLLQQNGLEHRTMGVLAKVDLLPAGSDEEKSCVQMIRASEERGVRGETVPKETPQFGLGWHVISSPSSMAEKGPGAGSANSRDELESEFFANRPTWSSIAAEYLGASKLRIRLGQQLLAYVQRDLPDLVVRSKEGMKKRNDRLLQLGAPRETGQAKRDYLVEISEQLGPLTRSAVDANYSSSSLDPGLRAFFRKGERCRLRDRLNSHLDTLTQEMCRSGRLYRIGSRQQSDDEYPPLPLDTTIHFPTSTWNGKPTKRWVSFDRYVRELALHDHRTRGTGVAGTLSSLTFDAIFKQQSSPWDSIVQKCTERCLSSVRIFLREAAAHIAGPRTADKLMENLIMDKFEQREADFNAKSEELMWPYVFSHPVINRTTQNSLTLSQRKDHSIASEPSWVDELGANPEPALLPAAQIMDQVDHYYQTAMNTLIQNFATLAVEKCLLFRLAEVFSPKAIRELDDTTVDLIASEPPDAAEQRARYTRQAQTLSRVLKVCSAHLSDQIGEQDKHTVHSIVAAGIGAPKTRSDTNIFGKSVLASNSMTAPIQFDFNQPLPPATPLETTEHASPAFTFAGPTGLGVSGGFGTSASLFNPSNVFGARNPFGSTSSPEFGKPDPPSHAWTGSSMNKGQGASSASSVLSPQAGAFLKPYVLQQDGSFWDHYQSISSAPMAAELSHEELRLTFLRMGPSSVESKIRTLD